MGKLFSAFSRFKSMLKLRTVTMIIPVYLCSCGISPVVEDPSILRDLAYTESKAENQYTVWIEENEEDTPYLVLTKQYNKQKVCLLLRKYALDELHCFNHNEPYASYYPDSSIDCYLNNEFRLMLPESLCDILCSSEITVTSKGSLGYCGKDTETIQRNIFLLSAVEAGGRSAATLPREGNQISYFSSNERRIVQTSSGTITSWWLRTPNTWHDNVVCGVNTEGVIGIGGVGGFGEDYLNGVRPAFCLDAETPIQKRGDLFYLVLK